MTEKIFLREELKLVTFLPKDPESPFPPEKFASSHIILISIEGKIYLTRETKDSRFNLPGGGKRKKETATQTATRECQEELGINLDEADLEYVGSLVLYDHIMFPIFVVNNSHKYQPVLVAKIETIALEFEQFVELVQSMNKQLGPFLDLVLGKIAEMKTK